MSGAREVLDAICETVRLAAYWSDTHSSVHQIGEFERRIRNEAHRNGVEAAARLAVSFIDEIRGES